MLKRRGWNDGLIMIEGKSQTTGNWESWWCAEIRLGGRMVGLLQTTLGDYIANGDDSRGI